MIKLLNPAFPDLKIQVSFPIMIMMMMMTMTMMMMMMMMIINSHTACIYYSRGALLSYEGPQ